MRKLILLAAAVLAACGGSSSSSTPNPTPLGGRVAGHVFTPVETRAVLLGTGSTPCVFNPTDPVNITTVGFKALVIEAASYGAASGGGVCGDLASIQCRYHQSSQNVSVLIARVNLAGVAPPEPPLGPGTYVASASLADLSLGYIGWAQTLDVGPSPDYAATTSTDVLGSIRLDAVPASSTAAVSGHLALGFDAGNGVAGDFTAPYCTGGLPDPCALAGTIFLAIQTGGAGAAGLCVPPAVQVP